MRSFGVCALFLYLAAAGCASTVPRQVQPAATSGEVCGSPEPGERGNTQLTRAALERVIDEVFDWGQPNSPGVAVMILHDGRVLAHRQFGLASIEHGVPFTPNHVVRIPYSEGREFIAITAAFMEHDGLIRLDAPARNYFPRLPAWSSSVTILDLIHHRSGFVDEWSALLMMHGSMGNRLSDSQFLRLLYEQPMPEVEPVTGYMYSNSDYGLLRLILDRAAGGDLAGYMRRRIFAPLGMHSTRLFDDDAPVGVRDAVFYEPHGDGYRPSIQVKTSPGGRYVIATTACDLGRWSMAHSDSTSEISRAVARLLHGAAPVPAIDGHYAFGYTVADSYGTRVLRHEGTSELTYLTRVPDLGYSIVTFGNRYYDPAESRALERFLLDPTGDRPGARFPSEPVAVPPGDLDRYVGRYVSTNVPSWESHLPARQEIHVTANDNGLVASYRWDRMELVPVGLGRFSWHGGFYAALVDFDYREEDGRVTLVISFDDGRPSETYVRLPDWKPSPELLRRVVGRYYSPHLDYYWSIAVDDTGGLVLRAPTLADTTVEPYREDEFLLRHEKFPGVPARFWIRFHESDRGEVTHLTVFNPRFMHHRFNRVGVAGKREPRSN